MFQIDIFMTITIYMMPNPAETFKDEIDKLNKQ